MKIIYTSFFSNYDTLSPITVPEGWRALCFTDSIMPVKGWEIVSLEPAPKLFRHIKTCPHLFLPDHDLSIWIDANLIPQMPLNHIIKGKDQGYTLMQHPQRTSVWAEAQRCIELRKDDASVIADQVLKYKRQGYKDDNGMVATGVLVRTPGFEKFGEAWWDEIRNHSVRDQISFPVVAQQHRLHFKLFPFLQGFKRVMHTGKKQTV